MMKLREIYDKRIDRAINPAVVVSNQNAETVEAEIKEYILTYELIEKLYLLLDTVVNKKSGKSGVWINGYYGSGKSHFIKYAHYCLDPQHSETAFMHFGKAVEKYDTTKAHTNENITVSNLALLKKKIDASHFDNIMFNVEDETDDGSGERLTRIFLNMFNKFRGYNSNDIPLALLLEKYLDKKGKFKEFQTLVEEEMGYNWQQDAAQVAAFELENVLAIAKRLVPDLDTVSLHAKLTHPDAFKISIAGTLIPEFQEYLQTKDPNYRLLFLVDEVSQYIGTNKEILLNFQNIIERVSEDCQNKVWIACTAQQTLEEVSVGTNGTANLQDEFGKILGRFDTRISLQSNDSAYITQKRVLDKNSQGIEVLSRMYEEHVDYIQNQFKISHELYKGYQNENDFILAYPFVPYQFKLIAHVFEAFQQLRYVIKEVKDNERSVLGITHFTAKQNADLEVGGFTPFDAFFNSQFLTNLTQRGTRGIENGLEITKGDPFGQRVVKTLFMISNLLEAQRHTFPSNIDNLTVLMMDSLDQNKMKLRNEIKAVLDKLIDESIIREEKGSYFFFNEDEMDVQNMIKQMVLGFDDKITRFDDLFRRINKINQKVSFGQNDFRLGYWVEGKEIFRGGDVVLKVLFTDNAPIENKALSLNRIDLAVCINEWFNKDESLRKDFDWYCQTQKYLSNNGDMATGERSKTLENFKIRNNELEKKIVYRLEQKMAETRFISQQQVWESDQVNGSAPADRMKNAIEKHLSGIYKNHQLAAGYAQNQAELKKSAASLMQTLDNSLTPAEIVVNDLISSYNHQMNVNDLINEFAKPPFGWRHEALLDVLVQLVKKKKREFAYRNQPRYPIVDFINKAVSTAERISCEVRTGEDIDQTTLDQVVQAYKAIFNSDLRTTGNGNEQYEILIGELKRQADHYTAYEESYSVAYPFGTCFHEVRKWLTKCIETRDPKKLFTDFVANSEESARLIDKVKAMAEFASQQVKDYDAIGKFYKDNQENFKELSPDNQAKADKIGDFLLLEDPRRDYRHARKAYDELKQALTAYSKELIEEITTLYEQIFDELDAEADKQGVARNVYANRQTILNQIKGLKSIPQLKNKKLDAGNFKSAQITQIIQYAAKMQPKEGMEQPVGEPEVYYITNVKTTVSNKEELEKYLAQVREDMLKLLAKNKTIIIK